VKIDDTRFTIRFGKADPKHQFASHMLKAVGRRKANLIADALWEYYAKYGGDMAVMEKTRPSSSMPPIFPAMPPPSTKSVYNISNEPSEPSEVLESSSAPSEPSELSKTEPISIQGGIADDDYMRKVVLGGLSAFIT